MENKEITKELVPCYKCILRPTCQNKTHIVCSPLFFFIISNSDFEDLFRVKTPEMRELMKELFHNLENVKPEKGYYDEVTTM
jgi:hypothetical protein